MDEMITLLKQVGIFMVCAQTVLHFKPQQKYDKYLKLLIGIMVTAQLVSPLFSLLGAGQVIVPQSTFPDMWDENTFDIDQMLGTADGIVDKYTESEIKSRLNNTEQSDEAGDVEVEVGVGVGGIKDIEAVEVEVGAAKDDGLGNVKEDVAGRTVE